MNGMSDDLISRKAVLHILYDIKDDDNVPKNYGTVLDIIRKIRKLPTAFDKEKVTQELKSNMESAQLAQLLVGTDLVQCGGFSYGYYNGVKDAVKIVEKGGIE